MLPPIPPITGWHVIMVHLPIGFLVLAPVFLFLMLLVPKHRTCFGNCFLIVLALGAIAAFFAVWTGEIAANAVKDPFPEIENAIHDHEEMAELARTLFAILLVVFAAIWYGPTLMKKTMKPRVEKAVHIVFLVLYLGALLVLAEAAHRGGMLVHHYGVIAQIDPPGQQ